MCKALMHYFQNVLMNALFLKCGECGVNNTHPTKEHYVNCMCMDK